jgi:hypothetical protein
MAELPNVTFLLLRRRSFALTIASQGSLRCAFEPPLHSWQHCC